MANRGALGVPPVAAIAASCAASDSAAARPASCAAGSRACARWMISCATTARPSGVVGSTPGWIDTALPWATPRAPRTSVGARPFSPTRISGATPSDAPKLGGEPGYRDGSSLVRVCAQKVESERVFRDRQGPTVNCDIGSVGRRALNRACPGAVLPPSSPTAPRLGDVDRRPRHASPPDRAAARRRGVAARRLARGVVGRLAGVGVVENEHRAGPIDRPGARLRGAATRPVRWAFGPCAPSAVLAQGSGGRRHIRWRCPRFAQSTQAPRIARPVPVSPRPIRAPYRNAPDATLARHQPALMLNYRLFRPPYQSRWRRTASSSSNNRV